MKDYIITLLGGYTNEQVTEIAETIVNKMEMQYAPHPTVVHGFMHHKQETPS